MNNLSDDYEVCNCKSVKLKDIKTCISSKGVTTLREIQEITRAGTDCRHCLFEQVDFGKIKKKIYCKDILENIKR